VKGTTFVKEVGGEVEHISITNIESEAVQEILYHVRTQYLRITYRTNGRDYWYSRVGLATFIDLITADSVGGFVNSRIKPNHDYSEDVAELLVR
jgi:hypothetical protein